jgi:hypothetical protein
VTTESPSRVSRLLLGLGGFALLLALPSHPQDLPSGPPTRERTYRIEKLTGGDKALRERFSPEQLALLEKLNRATWST